MCQIDRKIVGILQVHVCQLNQQISIYNLCECAPMHVHPSELLKEMLQIPPVAREKLKHKCVRSVQVLYRMGPVGHLNSPRTPRPLLRNDTMAEYLFVETAK